MKKDRIQQIISIAKQAGAAILSVYSQQQTLTVAKKADQTPLTKADLLAHQLITEKLQQLTPEIPVLSEESAFISYEERQSWDQYWLVDPLDGTKEFIKHNGEFTVNIALISANMATLGVIYAPVLDTCYFAALAEGAFKQVGNEQPLSIHTQKWNGRTVRVAGSRSHGQTRLQSILERLDDYEIVNMGSSLKSCLVAEGKADIYPRFGPTSEWDTAAAQCIVTEAGGRIIDLEGQPLQYNCKDSLINPWFFVVGDGSVDWVKLFSPIDPLF